MDRRAVLAGAGLTFSTSSVGCTSWMHSGGPPRDEPPECPPTIPHVEQADFDGEFRMECDHADEDDAPTDTSFDTDPRVAQLPDAEVTFTLTNRRDEHYNTNTFSWTIQKYVDDEWRVAVPALVPSDGHSSFAPRESHTWTVTFHGGSGEATLPLEPVQGDDTITVRGLDEGTCAFHVHGSYGDPGAGQFGNSPIIAYGARFFLDSD